MGAAQGAFLFFGPATHTFLQLFTNAELASGLALGQGLCWSIVFGFIAGALIALSLKLQIAKYQRDRFGPHAERSRRLNTRSAALQYRPPSPLPNAPTSCFDAILIARPKAAC